MLKTLAFFLLVLLLNQAGAQTYRFNQYTTEDGISQNFIYSISQAPNGYLWVGTGEGLCRFDGKHFKTYTTADGLSENIITISHVDNNGTQWLGHNEGGITKFSKGQFTAIAHKGINESKITSITSTSSSTLFISQNEGLFEIKNDQITKIGKFDADNFFSLQLIDQNNLVIGTDEGLIHIAKKNNNWQKVKTHKEDQWITDIASTNETGIFVFSSKSSGITKFKLDEDKLQFSTWDSNIDLTQYSIQTIIQDKDDNIWLGTFGQGLIKLHSDSSGLSDFETTIYNTKTGMSSDFVQSVYQDREGNIWVGTFGAGLSTLIDDFFTFYAHETYGNNINAIWVDEKNKWYGVENGLIKISAASEGDWQLFSGDNGFVNDKVTSLYEDEGVMWIGTETSGIYHLDIATNKIKKVNWDFGNLQNRVNQLTVNDGIVWIATEGGLIVYNISNNSTNLFNTEFGLAHNSIKSVCRSSDGRVWMGTHSRFIYALHNSSIEEYEIRNAGDIEILAISEDLNDDIWFASAENGVYKKVGKTFINFRAEDGLKTNYCYALHTDSKGYMWVGHRGGLSKISPDTERIIFYDHKSGIDGQINQNAMFLDKKNYLWIGTDGGAIQYDPSKDKINTVAPVINLLQVTIGDDVYNIDKPINLPYGNYRISFDFIGISFKNPENVQYKFKLAGYDEIFSDPTHDPAATYGRISDGSYEFKVVACTDMHTCSEFPATIKINIAAPFWKKWWFYLLLALFISFGMYIFIKQRVKRLKATQAYLEEQLDIKTKEVVEKAERIEEINKDLTSSISYAQRIQSAILPKDEALSDYFPNSFIFFKPRDVVSGDFYFIRKFEDKLIVACCDCTGHGVPGAFMSMIGSTTLRNIYKLMENSGNWRSPEKVLDLLDMEIQKILHQKAYDPTDQEDFFRSRDGMDLTLCEIDLTTNIISMSAAKRHSYIRMNNEIKILTGDKRGIGGGEEDEIDFTLSTYQMKPGDVLYLFSDGYSDQFGGPTGRKLKLSGVKKILAELDELETKNYSKHVANKFDAWQGDLDQIDDVLFMGIVF